ncbi:Glycine N-methyltransferase [Bagarius yarrelli]|uniref:Galectin n=1 Tax=Bagarius yarrelli TaxID=175774 RepID=A0A556U559_BAGYA|nr:Glycine N-methyltransferase [Bagarius yarrelli]
MVDSIYRTRSLGVAAVGLPDQYADGKAAKVWQLYIGDTKSRTEEYRSWLVSLLKQQGCKTVLDVACGTGVDSIMLVEEGFKVVSVDASDKMLKHALKERWERRKEPAFDNWVIEEANWLSLVDEVPKPGDGFDAVICLGNSFAHLPDFKGDQSDQKLALQNIACMVKPGGILIIDHRNYDYILETGKAPQGKNIYYQSDLKQEIDTSVLWVNNKPTMVTLDYSLEIPQLEGSQIAPETRFQFDLTCGSSTKPRADIAFHFNPRFRSSPCIVCNSLQQGNWGQEKILELMPFKQGAFFETIILVQEDLFKVAVNGAHVLEYQHRIPSHRVDTFSISGKVQIQAIGYVSSSCIPYKGSILKGLSPGQHITIKGHVSLFPHRCNESKNIALHFNARIKSGTLIRNSLLSESWGPEETELKYFPFTAGKYFEIIILCQTHQFKVAVNGEHLLEYRHRVQDLSSITQLEVLGDLDLQDIKLW